MADLDQGTEKEALHIQDCRVWAEIYYLDSPTDYREYLPQECLHSEETRPEMLTVANSCQFPKANGTSLPILGVGIILILVSGYLLYLLLDAF